MNAQRDEAKRLRIRDTDLVDGYSQSGRDPSLGMPCQVVQTTTITRYPTSAQSFYACAPLTILGSEVEGGSGVVTTGPSKFFALNVGSAIPPVGTSLVVTFVDHRWVFRYDG